MRMTVAANDDEDVDDDDVDDVDDDDDVDDVDDDVDVEVDVDVDDDDGGRKEGREVELRQKSNNPNLKGGEKTFFYIFSINSNNTLDFLFIKQ